MKRINLLLILLLPFQLMGQAVYTYNQKIIEESISGGLFIINQSYQLKDSTNQLFGSQGKNIFGEKYSIGIKIKNGCCITDEIINPWDYDENYVTFSTTHIPVLFKTNYKELTDSCMIELQGFDSLYKKNLYNNKIYVFHDSTLFNGKGFQIDTVSGEKKGWLVWLVSNNLIESSDSIISTSYLIYKKDLTYNNTIREIEINKPVTGKNIWGGIFLIPAQTAIGQITFKLSGIILDKNDSTAAIINPFIGNSGIFIQTDRNINQNVLTPITPQNEENTTGTNHPKKKKSKK